MIGIPIAIAYANMGEWLVHKYILHGLGKNKKSFWSFHFHEHHNWVRRMEGRDPNYERPTFGWHAQGKEALSLIFAGATHLPLLPVAPFFTVTYWICLLNYHHVHKKSHLDPEWAKEHLPWHYDHHMGPNQDLNWCVTKPWFDHLMGTRSRYLGTDRQKKDLDRRVSKTPNRVTSC